MTREYPPEVYGGAGVYVTELVTQLRRLCAVDVHCMGGLRPGAAGVQVHQPDPRLQGANPALSTLSADLMMANAAAEASVVHSHTWYTGMAGHLAALLHDIPHVLTAHSLEPLRPWKAEQLGGGYRISTWVEHTAVLAAHAGIAVSSAMREDILRVYPALDPSAVHVIRNGVDTDVWYPAGPMQTGSMLAELGIDPARPLVVFVGRITRQKGLAHLVAAAHRFSPEVQVLLCAGAPDTPEIADEIRDAVAALARGRTGVFWIREMLPIGELREMLSAASVFVCPSVYEPLGIVSLEAMACAAPVWPPTSAASRRWSPTGSPARWCITTRATRRASRPDWPTRSTNSSPTGKRRSATAGQGASAASRSSPGPRRRADPEDLSESVCIAPPTLVRRHALAGARDALEFVTEGGGFVGCQLDDQSTASFKWYPHHDAAPFLCRFERTVSGPGLHRRHRVLPPGSSWPALASLVGAGHAPPANFQPCPASNCLITPLLFPIQVTTCTKTHICVLSAPPRAPSNREYGRRPCRSPASAHRRWSARRSGSRAA